MKTVCLGHAYQSKACGSPKKSTKFMAFSNID